MLQISTGKFYSNGDCFHTKCKGRNSRVEVAVNFIGDLVGGYMVKKMIEQQEKQMAGK